MHIFTRIYCIVVIGMHMTYCYYYYYYYLIFIFQEVILEADC